MVRKFEALKSERAATCYSDITVIEPDENGIGYQCIADVWTDAADAKLLAAAPELLDKLKQLVAAVDIIPIPYASAITREARELIDQLEGENA